VHPGVPEPRAQHASTCYMESIFKGGLTNPRERRDARRPPPPRRRRRRRRGCVLLLGCSALLRLVRLGRVGRDDEGNSAIFSPRFRERDFEFHSSSSTEVDLERARSRRDARAASCALLIAAIMKRAFPRVERKTVSDCEEEFRRLKRLESVCPYRSQLSKWLKRRESIAIDSTIIICKLRMSTKAYIYIYIYMYI